MASAKLGWIIRSSSLKSEVKDLFPDLSFLGVSSKRAGLDGPSCPSSEQSCSSSELNGRLPGKGMGPPEGMTRGRFGFTGDGETGSPRRRFRARDMAEVGCCCGGRATCDEDATGWMRGNGSGDSSLLLAALRGVENGFGIGRVCSTCKTPLALFLTGEKGLADAVDG